MKPISRMAQSIEIVAKVDDTGLVDLGDLETYMRLFPNMSEDEVDGLIDDALECLVSEGTYVEVSGDYYHKDKMEEFERESQILKREAQDYEECVLDTYRRIAL